MSILQTLMDKVFEELEVKRGTAKVVEDQKA